MLAWLGRMWCKIWHRSIAYAGGTHYHCRKCRRLYLVPWSHHE